MPNRRAKKKLTLALDESGAVAIVFALAFAVLCGFMALAFDIGHMVLVKAELQRTADAAALAGVTGLVPYTGTGTNQAPDWVNGQSKARTMIPTEANEIEANKADNQIFATPEVIVDSGYWWFNPPIDYVQPPTDGLPKDRETTAAYLPVPAITVRLSRDVTLLFAPFVGVISPKTVTATATALLPESYSIAPGHTFTIAVDKATVYNANHTINVAPQDFGWKDHGQWYNIDGSNDVPTIRRGDKINALQAIYIAPGAKETLYDTRIIGQTIILAVVDSVEPKFWVNIIGFVAFKVTGVSSKSIEGDFLDKYFDPDVIPVQNTGEGTIIGVSGTPKLVGP